MMSSFLDADGREVGPQGLLVGIGDEQWSGAGRANPAGGTLERCGEQWSAGMRSVGGATTWEAQALQDRPALSSQQTQSSSSHGPQPAHPMPAVARLRLCDFWSRNGNCLHGDNCKFFHDPNTTPRPLKETHASRPSNAETEMRGGAGSGKQEAHMSPEKRSSSNNIAGHSSPLGASTSGNINAPRRVCDFFVKYGNCRSGRACKFLHVAPTLTSQQQQAQQQQQQLLQLLQEQHEMQALLTRQQTSSSSAMTLPWTPTRNNSLSSLQSFMSGGGLGLDGVDPSWRDMESAMQDWREHFQGRDSESEDGTGRGWEGEKPVSLQEQMMRAVKAPAARMASMPMASMPMASMPGVVGDFGARGQQQQQQQQQQMGKMIGGGRFNLAAAEWASIMAGKQHHAMQQHQAMHHQSEGKQQHAMNHQIAPGGGAHLVGAQGMLGIAGAQQQQQQQQQMQQQQQQMQLQAGLLARVGMPLGGPGGIRGKMGNLNAPCANSSSNIGGKGAQAGQAVRWAVGDDGTTWIISGDGWAYNSAGGSRQVCDVLNPVEGTCRYGAQCLALHYVAREGEVWRLVEKRGVPDNGLYMMGADALSLGPEDLSGYADMQQHTMGKMRMGGVFASQHGTSIGPAQQTMPGGPTGTLPMVGVPGGSPLSCMSSGLQDRWNSSGSEGSSDDGKWPGEAGDGMRKGNGSGRSNGHQGGMSDLQLRAASLIEQGPNNNSGGRSHSSLWGHGIDEVGRLGDYLRSSALAK